MSDFIIKPAKLIDPAHILKYWKDLSEVYSFLEYRFCNFKEPAITDALEHTYRNPYSTFFVLPNRSDPAVPIYAEYSIETFQTLYPRPGAAMIHFSFNPYFKDDIIRIVNYAHDVIFSTSLRSLIGLTPVTNRPAQVMLKRFGYKRLTVLPKAAYHHGEPVDGILSVRKKKTNDER